MNKIWSDEAWEDYLYWQTQDKKTLRRINTLIKDIERNGPMNGIGEPEALKENLQGCRQVADQAEDDFDYGKLEPVIQISIMDYTLFPDHRKFFARYIPSDPEDGYPFTDKIQFYVMDLTAMDLATDEQRAQGLTEWGRAFKAESWEEVNGIENPEVKEAAKTMEMIMSNPTQREWIRMRRDAEIDRRTEIRAAERNAHIKDAKRLKQLNVDPSIISSATGLSLAEIEKL